MPYKKTGPKVYTKYTPPPETEIILTALQELYLKPDCSRALRDRYFMLMRSYARSILLKEIKRKGIVFPPEKVEELATDSTLLLMNQYTKE